MIDVCDQFPTFTQRSETVDGFVIIIRAWVREFYKTRWISWVNRRTSGIVGTDKVRTLTLLHVPALGVL